VPVPVLQNSEWSDPEPSIETQLYTGEAVYWLRSKIRCLERVYSFRRGQIEEEKRKMTNKSATKQQKATESSELGVLFDGHIAREFSVRK